jgi:hypothetical protein
VIVQDCRICGCSGLFRLSNFAGVQDCSDCSGLFRIVEFCGVFRIVQGLPNFAVSRIVQIVGILRCL